MKEHTLYFILICLFTIVVYAGYMQATVYGQEKLKFNTQKTRELWQVCSVSFRNKHPGVPIDIYYPVCDCYVDHIRANYEPDVLESMKPEEYIKLSQELKYKCNPKNPEELT